MMSCLILKYNPILAADHTFFEYFGAFIVLAILIGLLFLKPFLASRKPRFDFINEFMVLTAYILKIDGEVTHKELEYVKAFIKQEFGEKKHEENIKILYKHVNRGTPIRGILKKLDYEEAPDTKRQLLHHLIRITIIDKYLKTAEYQALVVIRQGLGINDARFQSLLSLYNFTTETEHKQQQSSRGKKNREVRPRGRSLKNAYSVLKISETSNVKQIKKAYRKLVLIYHPDKILNLNDDQKMVAKAKFQKINDAYDLIKSHLNFK